MTQSGQGDEQQLPAVRPAHEGVVLPAGGGEPWIPGGPADQAAPAGGQPWGQPWGPQAAHPDASSQQPQQQSQPYQPQPHQQPQQQAHGQGQGAYGQAQYGAGQQPAPGYGQQPPAQQPPAQQYGQMPQAQPQPQAPQPPHVQPPHVQAQQPPQPQHSQQLPPMQQPQHSQQAQQPFAQPLPPEAVPGGVPGGDEAATQYIAPVPAGPAPGGLPPESPAESTHFLGRGVPPQQPPQQQYQQQPPGQGGDAEATQYIPPVPGGTPYGIRPGAPGDRQPPAEFDSLFRNDEPAGSTQQMPLPDHPQQHQPHQPHQQPQPHQYAGDRQPPYRPVDEDPYEPQPRKRRAHVTLIAAVVAGCAVVGLGAGALLSGGDDKGDEGKEPVGSASTPAVQQSSSPEAEADPVKPQAEALDKLLADSNNSRAAVIGAVEKTKNCTDLDQAVADLKDAAKQRRDLVTRLQGLSVDKLPNNARLTASLTKAWQASASADDHYAAWAAQAKNGKKVCKHGKARTTTETQKATAQSGEASRAKREAAGLWNSIASKYGLTQRTATQL
ncbi:hypothetical protein [Streptomyces sp. NPDC057496]|uniref:hypothetical protein n=1 Tax=Streptomyces sp. NPDC057496 TaxID=3346149 RepID=UPI0036792AF1